MPGHRVPSAGVREMPSAGPMPPPTPLFETVHLSRRQVLGEAIDERPPGQETKVTGVHVTFFGRHAEASGKLRRAALDQGPANGMRLGIEFGQKLREGPFPHVSDAEPLAIVDVAESVDMTLSGDCRSS